MSHILITLAAQVAVGLVSRRWLAGGVLMIAFYVGREFTQAEYRWIAAYGAGERANMPLLAGFDPRVWNAKSLSDFLLPLVAVLSVYACMVGLRRLRRR